jgi:hypothetical protein
MSTTSVTTSIKNAVFADGSVLSGTWTATYDDAGNLLSVSNASFTVTGSGGTNTFTNAGTLPYAISATGSSYEIHFLSQSGTGSYSSLYVDWRGENPSSLYEGSPSLYTSVVNGSSTPIRLVSDGTTGQGSLPVITGLPAGEASQDNVTSLPFSGVTVTNQDGNTSATITLRDASGHPTDLNGTLSGTGLTKTGVGTYSLSSATPATLSSELQALKFSPVKGLAAPGKTVATTITLSANDSDGSASVSTTLTVTATCFLRGTAIATPHGERAVEELAAGELVTVMENGEAVSRPIRWIGGHRMVAAQHDNRDEAFPVRIRAGAFAPDVPHRDLLVTPEHCILVGGGLVPVRMLVNGGSILIDRSLPEYDFFHIELDQHGILLSEGLTTESYLDTGNRGLFGELADGAPVVQQAPAAPLTVAREQVEPIWNQLRDRSEQLGFAAAHAAPSLTAEPDLRVLLSNGRELRPCWQDETRHMFRLPNGTRPVRLLSRASVPAQIIGPFVDDRRSLGVAVKKLVLWDGLNGVVVPTEALALQGWHADEGTHRWTDGKAELALPDAGVETFLDVHVAATASYAA